jgi:hypothetical protein
MSGVRIQGTAHWTGRCWYRLVETRRDFYQQKIGKQQERQKVSLHFSVSSLLKNCCFTIQRAREVYVPGDSS